jgi:large subunit ribosomal protein L23
MALKDFFKRKKSFPEKTKEIEEKKKGEREKKEIKEQRESEVEEKKELKEIEGKRERKGKGVVPMVLYSPHIAEKSTKLIEMNQYVFKVFPKANKTEIKKAVENIYGVNVLSVRVIKLPKKKRRVGGREGWRKGFKKAIVKIKEGQKIEILPR